MSSSTFGKYQLLAQLGKGGMAEVYLAVVQGIGGFNKLLVVKKMRDDVAEDPAFVAMLMDEARLAAQLNHPNVVQTIEVGDIDGQYYIAMEYLDGQPLHRIQHRARSKPEKFSKDLSYLVICDALLGLHHAHELKDFQGNLLEVVHRDVTPHNIFVTYEGQTKVVDFGVAKARGRSQETQHGVMKGKIRYMAPEQATNTRVDRRTDVFAAGVMLWEAAVGERFWSNDLNEINVLQRLMTGDFDPSPKVKNPDVPDAIDAMCKKAMASKQEERYATALEFRGELEQFLAETGTLIKSKRELGPAVGAMFEDVRSELKRVTDTQLEKLSHEEPLLLETVRSADSTTNLGEPFPSVTTADGGPSTQAKPQTSKAKYAGMALVGAALVGGGIFVATRAPATPINAAATTTVGQIGTRPSQAHIHLEAIPATATIRLDGRAVANPYEADADASESLHVVSVEAEGYSTVREDLVFKGTISRTFALTPAEAKVPEGLVGGARPPRGGAAIAARPGGNSPTSSTASIVTGTASQATGSGANGSGPTELPGGRVPKPIDTSDPWAENKKAPK